MDKVSSTCNQERGVGVLYQRGRAGSTTSNMMFEIVLFLWSRCIKQRHQCTTVSHCSYLFMYSLDRLAWKILLKYLRWMLKVLNMMFSHRCSERPPSQVAKTIYLLKYQSNCIMELVCTILHGSSVGVMLVRFSGMMYNLGGYLPVKLEEQETCDSCMEVLYVRVFCDWQIISPKMDHNSNNNV